jgi:putative hydrolase of HD superfamily
VEIYTGDIVCTDFEKKAEKRKLEQQSADRIFGLLPNSLKDEICNLWLEYDLGKTVEAKVVKSLDKICYIIHYSISGKIIWPPEEEDTKEERREYAHTI